MSTRTIPSIAPHEPRLARVAAMIADPTRARMLCFLLTGEYASAGELARAASVSPQTASGHLAKLTDGELIVCEQRGRHRYFRIADADIAHALEALAMVAERGSHQRSWSSPARQRLREARCCYGHLAGRLGVDLMERMVSLGWLAPGDGGFALTAAGETGLGKLGIQPASWRAPSTARFAYPCLDWSERRDHLAGRLASAMLDHFLERGWLRRTEGERAVSVTPTGFQVLGDVLGGAAIVTPETPVTALKSAA